MSDMTTVGVTKEVLTLIDAIAAKRSEELGFHIGKGDIVRNLVVAEARSLGLLKGVRGPGIARAKRSKR